MQSANRAPFLRTDRDTRPHTSAIQQERGIQLSPIENRAESSTNIITTIDLEKITKKEIQKAINLSKYF